ncbi:MAG: hypothetical protein HY360_23075 [Verrucomicrobia bacterium]|nr:hypothetical protein [Verrucomicrobiota bacterium]
MFSARTANAGYLQQIHDRVGRMLEAKGDQATMRLELKQALQTLDYQPDPDKRGGLQDLSSDARLNLILETNVRMAQGYVYWKQGQDEAILEAFPAQELIRAEDRAIPRDWPGRWAEAGGQFFDGGRMIALKNDPIWTEISAFGLPYAPFDFNSGMDVMDVSRDEAIELGVLDSEDPPPLPEDRGFNEDLELSAASLDLKLRLALAQSMGDEAEIRNDVLRLKNQPETWQSLKLPPLAQITPAPAPARDSPQEAEQKLRAGISLKTPLGEKVEFGPLLLDHIKDRDQGRRIIDLPFAEAAVREPLEIWRFQKRDRYIKTFELESGKKTGALVVVVTGNNVLTFQRARLNDLNKSRKGELLFAEA